MNDESNDLPAFPKPGSGGNYSAPEFMRVSIARDLAKRRRALRLSRGELACHANLPQATLDRIEKAKVDPQVETVDRILDALESAADI